jgi:hypothetical protein
MVDSIGVGWCQFCVVVVWSCFKGIVNWHCILAVFGINSGEVVSVSADGFDGFS